tara:strand:+ start:797 stop:1195 length:399 start_codon:yes stop_codon:yes gene_type:complete
MAAGQYSFIIEQGATVDFRIDYTDSNGDAVDLSNYEARMQIRNAKGGTTLYASLSSSLDACGSGLNMTPTSASVTLPKSSGSIGVFISAASSSAFTFDRAYYDLEIYSGSGNCTRVDRILEGRVKLSKEVTT